jgi:phosphate acyltransferase
MGNIFSREILGRKQPRVGILCNGTEDHKGNEVTREAAKLCQQVKDLNYIGYVEGSTMFSDVVDVVVTDGFTGNIVLKTCEGMGKAMMRILKRELTANPVRRIGAALAGKAFLNLKNKFDPDVYGGAPILGLNGTVIKAHGSARQYAIMNALRVCTEAIQHHLNEMIQQEIQRANQAAVVPAPAVVPA